MVTSNIGKRRSVAEYNGNNAWLYNGNNGRFNNNNKNNAYSVRSLLDYYTANNCSLEDYLIPLHEWYGVIAVCRRNKSVKPSWLIFDAKRIEKTAYIAHMIGNMEYVPQESICFIILKPRIREVMAADFADRCVQTWYVNMLKPLLEERHLHKDSYSCRIGKGGLRAVQQLREYIYEESNGYSQDVWIATRDIHSFFMSIDTDMAVRRMEEFIRDNFFDSKYFDLLMYLTRIIYQYLPQDNCFVKSPKWMWTNLPASKSLLGTDGTHGMPIGNVTSQMMANFLTSFYLNYLESLGYKFIHYTDDTTIVVKDLERWKDDEDMIAIYLHQELGLVMHPKKKYLQHYSKGVQTLGFKVRFGRILPSDRIYHNFLWKIEYMTRNASESEKYLHSHKESFMQTINSYLGMFKWCDTFMLRKRIIISLRNSVWAKVYDIHDNKVTIKHNQTHIQIYKNENRNRRKLAIHEYKSLVA